MARHRNIADLTSTAFAVITYNAFINCRHSGKCAVRQTKGRVFQVRQQSRTAAIFFELQQTNLPAAKHDLIFAALTPG